VSRHNTGCSVDSLSGTRQSATPLEFENPDLCRATPPPGHSPDSWKATLEPNYMGVNTYSCSGLGSVSDAGCRVRDDQRTPKVSVAHFDS